MNYSQASNNICLAFFIFSICFGLWVTSPSKAINQCEKVNTEDVCNILNAE